MTTYEKELIEIIGNRYANIGNKQLLETLMKMGVVDYSRCKILAVREHVATLVKNGEKKTDSMYMAAEKFVCSYEYVRKCIYYYTDVNII